MALTGRPLQAPPRYRTRRLPIIDIIKTAGDAARNKGSLLLTMVDGTAAAWLATLVAVMFGMGALAQGEKTLAAVSAVAIIKVYAAASAGEFLIPTMAIVWTVRAYCARRPAGAKTPYQPWMSA